MLWRKAAQSTHYSALVVSCPRAMVLTPGAGSSSDHRSLRAIDEALSALGIVVVRIDFPYRLAGRKIPDRAPVLIEAIQQAAMSLAEARSFDQDAILLGGRSMGGRMCSMAVADGFPAAGLVAVSYPLHPPGQPERLRSGHFSSIGVPCLFISGDRDAYATRQELTHEMNAINAEVTHHFIDGGDHSLRGHDDEVARLVKHWVARRLSTEG